jgi:hypothetical protein
MMTAIIKKDSSHKLLEKKLPEKTGPVASKNG